MIFEINNQVTKDRRMVSTTRPSKLDRQREKLPFGQLSMADDISPQPYAGWMYLTTPFRYQMGFNSLLVSESLSCPPNSLNEEVVLFSPNLDVLVNAIRGAWKWHKQFHNNPFRVRSMTDSMSGGFLSFRPSINTGIYCSCCVPVWAISTFPNKTNQSAVNHNERAYKHSPVCLE